MKPKLDLLFSFLGVNPQIINCFAGMKQVFRLVIMVWGLLWLFSLPGCLLMSKHLLRFPGNTLLCILIHTVIWGGVFLCFRLFIKLILLNQYKFILPVLLLPVTIITYLPTLFASYCFPYLGIKLSFKEIFYLCSDNWLLPVSLLLLISLIQIIPFYLISTISEKYQFILQLKHKQE